MIVPTFWCLLHAEVEVALHVQKLMRTHPRATSFAVRDRNPEAQAEALAGLDELFSLVESEQPSRQEKSQLPAEKAVNSASFSPS